MKPCTLCGQTKPYADYQRDKSTYDGLRARCRTCCQRGQAASRHGGETPPPAPTRHASPDYERLFEAVRANPVTILELADKLDMSPAKTRALAEAAKVNGYAIRLERDLVGADAPAPDERIRTVGVAPAVGERRRIGVISDTHLGSKYCLREQLREFIQYAYDQGVREIVHPGDVLDGCYRHSEFELSHVGIDEQTRDLFETLPTLPGLSYRCITGNHDHTFTERTGIDVGHYVTGYFRQRGRSDVHFYGNRSAFIRIGGAVIHAWHPGGGGSYARSYKLQKQVEKYASGEKPNVLLTGHYHTYCHIFERGVHALLCPTFQGGGSQFSKSLGGSPAIGGMVLSWDMTEHGTMRNFVHEYRAYFERERPHRIEDDTAYREEHPA